MKQSKTPLYKKTIYVDVFKGGRFYTQVPYTYCPLWKFDMEKVKEHVVTKLPSLAGTEIDFEISQNRL